MLSAFSTGTIEPLLVSAVDSKVNKSTTVTKRQLV